MNKIREKTIMNIFSETRCLICSSIMNYENSKIIDAHVRDILDVLLLKLNLDGEANFLCDICCTKLFAAFDFKVTCINTEDTIFPYTNSEDGKLLDIKEIYLKENEGEQLKDIHEKVCRLCFHVISNETVLLGEVNRDNIRRYIPEVNFNSTKYPVFCKACYESLNNHCNFLKSCLTEEVTKCEVSYEAINIHSNILKSCSDDVDFKIEASNESINTYSNSLNSCLNVEETKFVIKKEDTETNIEINKNCNPDANNPMSFESDGIIDSQSGLRGKGTVYICNKCEFKTTHTYMCREDVSVHVFPDEKEMFQCDQCNYKTSRKHHVLDHQFIHSAPLEVKIYKCHECDYESIFETFFIKHRQEHAFDHNCVPLKKKIYKCHKCPYETKSNKWLVTHQLKHTMPVKLFKCMTCTFESRFKTSLLKHRRSYHRDGLKEQIFRCDKCKYRTKKKGRLAVHRKKHEKHKACHKCDKCQFQSKCRSDLERHQIKHQDPSEVYIYKCHKCIYETKYKHHFRRHVRSHEETWKVETMNVITRQD